jgi:hypothetical protein
MLSENEARPRLAGRGALNLESFVVDAVDAGPARYIAVFCGWLKGSHLRLKERVRYARRW